MHAIERMTRMMGLRQQPSRLWEPEGCKRPPWGVVSSQLVLGDKVVRSRPGGQEPYCRTRSWDSFQCNGKPLEDFWWGNCDLMGLQGRKCDEEGKKWNQEH